MEIASESSPISARNFAGVIKSLRFVFHFIGAYPLLWFSTVITVYLRARLYLGYWPTYGAPDPKHLPFTYHYGIPQLGTYLLGFSVILLPILGIALRKHLGAKAWRSVALYAAGWAVIVSSCYLPRGANFLSWFLD